MRRLRRPFRHTRRNRARFFRHRCQWRSVTADGGLPGRVSGGAERRVIPISSSTCCVISQRFQHTIAPRQFATMMNVRLGNVFVVSSAFEFIPLLLSLDFLILILFHIRHISVKWFCIRLHSCYYFPFRSSSPLFL
jgi:hypothetical protein